ncbi:MAG: hypothetical protein K9J17_06685 [Flavobacteriales bacterium]|nr:hypothetical protein [Flavobacteriales bacterium]
MKLFSNGFKGWKQSWKGDLRASISVAFIAIPLGLGIGLASGVPPLSAVIPSVVGGLFISWFSGGSIALHSTPKMLIGVTAAAVLSFGGDDVFLGYRFFLSAVVVAGLIQFILGILRMGVIGDLIPATVIKSLLASVGVIIIVKQIPALLGAETHAASLIQLVQEMKGLIGGVNPIVMFIGIISVLIMFVHPKIESPVIKALPAAVWVILISIAYSYALEFAEGGQYTIFQHTYEFGSKQLIALPSELSESIVMPDFGLWQTAHFWNIVLAIVLVTSIEGILSARAIDRLDPLKRKTNVNKELRAVGIGTSISGMLGGMPVIPGIVPSSVAVTHNGKTQLVDVFQAILILLLVVLLGSQLKHIPLAALAGILIQTGYKLLNPSEIRNVYRIGWDQVLIFFTTLLITLTFDLIIGIAAGVAITIVIHIIRLRSVMKLFTILFRPNVVAYEEGDENTFHVSVRGYSNFLNYSRLKKALDVIPSDSTINLDLSLTEFIDHTVLEHLAEFEESHIRRGGHFEIIGMDNHRTSTAHPLSVRFKGDSKVPRPANVTLTSRQKKLQALANTLNWKFELAVIRYVLSFEKFHLFRFRTVDRVYNRLIGTATDYDIVVQDVDFHEGEFQVKVDRQATVAVISVNRKMPLFTLEKEHIFDRVAALAGYDDIDFKDFRKFSNKFRLKGEDETAIRLFFNVELLEFLQNGTSYRLESTGDSMLVFGKERILSEREIEELIEFCSTLLSKLG